MEAGFIVSPGISLCVWLLKLQLLLPKAGIFTFPIAVLLQEDLHTVSFWLLQKL